MFISLKSDKGKCSFSASVPSAFLYSAKYGISMVQSARRALGYERAADSSRLQSYLPCETTLGQTGEVSLRTGGLLEQVIYRETTMHGGH